MTRTSLAVVMTLLVVAAGVAPFVAAATETTTTGQASDISPGEQLAGVVGVQGTELRGDVERRAFGQRIAAAASNASKAEVIATEIAALEQRLETLEDRKATLEQALANGSITRGEYAARMAHLIAEERALTRMVNTTSTAADDLPADVLRENGVNVSAIQELRENARNLTGSAVADIARQIAGPPDDRGNASDRGNGSPASATISQAASAIDVAETQIGHATDRVAADNSDLETAREKLDTARQKLEDARDAAADGDDAQAHSLAEEALQLAREAADLARNATPAGDGDATTTTDTPPTTDDETTTTSG